MIACDRLSTALIAREYRMRVGPITADGAGPVPVGIGRRHQAEMLQIRGRMFGANNNREAAAADVIVQQLHQSGLLFNHPEQRP